MKRNEPKVVQTFRKNYPNHIYIDVYDNGYKKEKLSAKNKKTVEKWMKDYINIRKKRGTFKQIRRDKGLGKFM